MTLSGAREEFLRAERLAVKFPDHAACQRQRRHAYDQWIRAVRCWRLSVEPPVTEDEPGNAIG